jgi:hypothetical protein
MIVEAKRLVCINQECKAEIIVVRKPALEKLNLRCACGSEFKRIYNPPVVTALGTVFELAETLPLDANWGHSLTLRWCRLQDHSGKSS